MRLTETKDGTVLSEQDYFDAEQTFCCGQCFRFDRTGDGFKGIAKGRVLSVRKCDGGWLFEGVTENEFNDVWYDYFDFASDYAKAAESFPASDAHLAEAAKNCRGIRLLKQDCWEATCSFIISANNNIPRIKKIVSSLCMLFGDEIGNGCFSFPTAERLSGLDEDALSPLKCGYRAPYILDAARKFASGETAPEKIAAMPYAEAKKELLRVKGIGPKVADCALLFGFGFREAFPIDTWVKKAMRDRYGNDFDPASFGPWAGLAQQYLFYYERGTRE